MIRTPKPMTRAALDELIADPNYWNPADPDFTARQKVVRDGFRELYPGAINATGLAAGNDNRADGRSHDGMVHVSQYQRGDSSVHEYWRHAPGTGTSPPSRAPHVAKDPEDLVRQ